MKKNFDLLLRMICLVDTCNLIAIDHKETIHPPFSNCSNTKTSNQDDE